MKNKILDALYITIGSMSLSFAITAILKPNNLMTGGITGLSVMLDEFLGIDYTYIYYGLSLLVLLITFLTIGKHEAKKIIILSVVFPFILMVVNKFNIRLVENDIFLASVYYGIFAGIGIALILKRGYSSGGTDSLGKIIHKKIYPYISINQIITFIDLTIILISILVFDVKIALYAIITQLVLLKTVEVALYGLSPKLVKLEIISDAEEKISQYILKDVKRGVSKYIIIGGYSNSQKSKLITICSPRESIMIKTYIADLDEKAFISVLPVMSVWGEGLGFHKIKDEQI